MPVAANLARDVQFLWQTLRIGFFLSHGGGVGCPRPVTDELQRPIEGRVTPCRVGQDAAHALSVWIAGDRPPAVDLDEHFNPACIIGIYRQGANSKN